MWKRLLLTIDDLESGQAALDFTLGLARAIDPDVYVLHFRELSMQAGVMPLETPKDARLLVDEAVSSLRAAGVRADGRGCSVPTNRIAPFIAEEAVRRHADAIVLGSRRLTGFSRLSGRGVRDRVLRLSHLPVIVAPAPLLDGVGSQRPGRGHPVSEHVPTRPPLDPTS